MGRSNPSSVWRVKAGVLKKLFCDVLCNVLCNLWCGSLWEGGMEYIHIGEKRFGRISFSLLFSLKRTCVSRGFFLGLTQWQQVVGCCKSGSLLQPRVAWRLQQVRLMVLHSAAHWAGSCHSGWRGCPELEVSPTLDLAPPTALPPSRMRFGCYRALLWLWIHLSFSKIQIVFLLSIRMCISTPKQNHVAAAQGKDVISSSLE